MSNQHPEKQWWAPVWKGLVMDPDARHCRQMTNALWLYLYLLLNANRTTGVLMRKVQTISNDMGMPSNDNQGCQNAAPVQHRSYRE